MSIDSYNHTLIEDIKVKLSILELSDLINVYNILSTNDILIYVDNMIFNIHNRAHNIYIADNGIYISLMIGDKPANLGDFSLGKVRLMEYYNKSHIKGLGHKVLCELFKTLVKYNVVFKNDDISWEVEPGSYKRMDSLVTYYKRIGGRVLNKDYENAKTHKFSIYMGTTVAELISHCQ